MTKTLEKGFNATIVKNIIIIQISANQVKNGFNLTLYKDNEISDQVLK